MVLSQIDIVNFRSIRKASLTFENNCLVLLGKNEAGKSNVLKAIASLFEMYNPSNKDKRKRIDNEKIEDFYVRAEIKLSKKDFKVVEENLKKKYKGFELIRFKSGISLNKFIEKVFYELLISIKISDNAKPFFQYWTYSQKDIELEEPLYLSIENEITNVTGKELNLIHLVFDIVKSLYLENPIKCHYWQYSDSYLLPNSVDIDDFISSPSKYKALENIFTLCGRDDIKAEFETAKSQDGDYSNLLEQVSSKVTITFQKIWKDFKGTSIQLLPNGEEILVKVVNIAKYNFEDRSDGFKKFISILLMLSTQSRSNKILDTDIILIDEPDQSLYPTSAQYLRDELIEISKKSKVIYSTHSQYMIDSNCLERHIVVEKKDDITNLEKQNANAPFTTDELLRRAIGSSIFECLKQKNIIFEGYLDKELFIKYCKSNKIDKDFNNYGNVYLSGISGIETLVQILTLANKKFIIVADSDETSNNKRIDFEKNYPEYKNCWLGYADVCKGVSTMEDFMSIEFIEEQLKNSGFPHIYEPGKNVNQNIEKAVNKNKEHKQQIKNLLVSKVKKENILANYSLYVNKLQEKLEGL